MQHHALLLRCCHCSTNKNFVLALVAVAAILLTVIIIGVAMTGPKRRSATNTMRTRPITVNTTAINITATVTTSGTITHHVADITLATGQIFDRF
jgi:hypothetical protein